MRKDQRAQACPRVCGRPASSPRSPWHRHRTTSATLRVGYAPNIPTLCASTSDCLASLGHDLGLHIGISRAFPRWHSLTAQLELYIGWEWLTTKLSDSGIASTRTWTGPTSMLEVFVDVRSRGPWCLGPAIGLSGGVFTHYELGTPTWQARGATAAAVHSWMAISFRVVRRL